MRKIVQSIVVAAFVAVIQAGGAHAAVIASKSGQSGFSANAPSATFDNAVQFLVDFSSPLVSSAPLLFDLTLENDGVFSVSSGQAFDDAVTLATNGNDDGFFLLDRSVYLSGGSGGGTGISQDESVFFAGTAGLNGVDFAGALIEEFVLTISNLQITAGQGFVIYSYDYQFDILGKLPAPLETPLPAAFPLFLAGMGLFASLCRRTKQGA